MRKSAYTAVVKGDQTYLLHNSLHGSIIKISDAENKAIIDAIADGDPFVFDSDNQCHSLLKKHGMIVEDHVKEHRMAEYVMRVHEKRDNLLGITMVLTRDCNFRCEYCYEELSHEVMPWVIYEETVDAIEALVKERGYKQVVITLFGGEPTLELDNACRFLELLHGRMEPYGVHVSGLIVTNGYLLDAERYAPLYRLGINGIQVTIDGLPYVHDSRRYLTGGEGSWHRIIDNMKSLKAMEGEFYVKIKTLFSNRPDGLKDIDPWFSFLKETFGDDPRFNYQFDTVRSNEEDVRGLTDYEFVRDNRARDAKAFEQIIPKAMEHGLGIDLYMYKLKRFGLYCYASTINNYLVDVDGKLRKCNFHLDDLHVGNLVNGRFQLDMGRMADCTCFGQDLECKTCLIYPICYGRHCPAHHERIYHDVDCDFYRNYHLTILKALNRPAPVTAT